MPYPFQSGSRGAALLVYFFLSLYVQGILGFSPTKAGLVFVPMALLITVVAPGSAKVVERIGAATTIGSGMLISAVGFLLLERLGRALTSRRFSPASSSSASVEASQPR